MVTEQQAASLIAEINTAFDSLDNPEAAILAGMRLIAKHLPHYHWVGVYLLDGGVLNLGPYVGAATEHTLIPVGRGVCGTAVAEGRNLVVDDVRTLDNYLSCSLDTRSEIVVLIRDPETSQILGQIDA
ncbi:MAG: GAF domain-containing protein, partial [Cytophagales bacterium]|nr:GAF domain-containing protein [Armatimonadota bacterium]